VAMDQTKRGGWGCQPSRTLVRLKDITYKEASVFNKISVTLCICFLALTALSLRLSASPFSHTAKPYGKVNEGTTVSELISILAEQTGLKSSKIRIAVSGEGDLSKNKMLESLHKNDQFRVLP